MVNKVIAGISAVAIAFGLGTFMPMQSQAAGTVNIRLKSQKYVYERDALNKDCAVKTYIYIEPDNKNERFGNLQMYFSADYSQFYFKNMVNPLKRSTTAYTYSYSGGTYTSYYEVPFVFGEITSNRITGRTLYNCANHQIATNAVLGGGALNDTDVYADGNGGVYIQSEKYGNYASNASAAGLSNAKNITITANNSGGYNFTFENPNGGEYTIEANYPLDLNLPKGTPIPGESSNIVWTTGNLDRGSAILGNIDEFPLTTVDIIMRKGKSKGVYTVGGFKPENRGSSASGESFISVEGSSKKYSASDGSLTITPAEIKVVDDYFGDVNKDGHVDAKDATEILKAYANAIYTGGKVTSIDEYIGDLDDDGNISSKDATWILRYYAGTIARTAKGSLVDYLNSNI